MTSTKQKRFSEQSIERLNYDRRKAPPSGKMEIRDDVVRGLLLRVTPRGVKSFSVIYKVPGEGGVSRSGRLLTGKQHRITLGTTPPLGLKEAREQARKIIEAATEGRDLRNERREQNITRHTNTFLAVRKRFIELEIKPNVKNWKTVESTLRLHAEPQWEGRPVLDIRRSDIHELLDDLVADDKIAIAREVRKYLAAELGTAGDAGNLKTAALREKLPAYVVAAIEHVTEPFVPLGADKSTSEAGDIV